MTYTVTADQITAADQSALLGSGDAAEAAGLQVEYGGEAVQAQPQTSSAEGLGVLVALLVLAVTFGSLLAAGLPLVTALVGVATGMAGVYALTSVLDLTSTAPRSASWSAWPSGIDYALFITTRHRENLAAGLDPQEAAGRAVGTAGSAVVFAGATVMIALAALSVVGIPFLTTMGLVAAGMVAIAVLVALTLVPAFLGFAGGRFDRWPIPGLRGRQARLGTRPSFGSRWAAAITAQPVAFLLVAIVGRGVIALPALKLRARPARRRHAADRAPRSARPTTCSPRASGPASTARSRSWSTAARTRSPRRPARWPGELPGPRRRRGGHPRGHQPGRRHRDHHRRPAERTRPRARPRTWSPASATSAAASSRRPAPTSWSPATRPSASTSRRSSPARCRSSCCWWSGCPSSC